MVNIICIIIFSISNFPHKMISCRGRGPAFPRYFPIEFESIFDLNIFPSPSIYTYRVEKLFISIKVRFCFFTTMEVAISDVIGSRLNMGKFKEYCNAVYTKKVITMPTDYQYEHFVIYFGFFIGLSTTNS